MMTSRKKEEKRSAVAAKVVTAASAKVNAMKVFIYTAISKQGLTSFAW